MELSTSELIKIGLLQGFPLVLLIGVYHLVRGQYKKRKQKKYISKIISTHVERILNAEDVPYPDPKSKRVFKADEVRKSHYDYMYKQIDNLLSHKAVELDYEDEKEIRDAFYYINLFEERNKFSGVYEIFPNLEVYEEKFIKKLKRIEWLKLEEVNALFSFPTGNK